MIFMKIWNYFNRDNHERLVHIEDKANAMMMDTHERLVHIENKLIHTKDKLIKDNLELGRKVVTLESMLNDIYDQLIKEKRICPICKSEIRAYIPFGVHLRPDAQCPVCLTVERHRLIWRYYELKLKDLLLTKNRNNKIRLLHFAPEKGLSDQFKLNENIEYYPVDFNPNYPGIIKAVDITDIPYDDNYFDFIICSHVIEHIPNEKKALSELRRVLKPTPEKNAMGGGYAIINAPVYWDLEKTLEDSKYNTPELREKYYGQFDHVRKYGRDYIEHLRSAGFIVERITEEDIFTKDEINYYALNSDDMYVCTKEY